MGRSSRGQLQGLAFSVAFFALYITIRGNFRIPPLLGLPSVLMFIFGCLYISKTIMPRLGQHARRNGLAFTIASHGFCGGCGYDLRAANPDANGLATCPECGARWSVARLRSAPLTQTLWNTLGRGFGRANKRARLNTDDRGALIRRILSTPTSYPSAGRELWTPEHHESMLQIRRKMGFKSRIFGASIGALFLALAVWFAVMASQNFGGDKLLPIAAAGLLTIFGANISFVFWTSDFGVKGKPFVRLVCDAGICAACATPLDIKTKDADGFFVCVSCGSSWKPGVAAAMLDAI